MSGYVKITSVDGHMESGIGFDSMDDLVEQLMEDHDFACEEEAIDIARKIINGKEITIDNCIYKLGYYQ